MTAVHWKRAADGVVTSLRGVFGDRLQSVIVYGPRVEHDVDGLILSLGLTSSLTVGDLESCAARVHGWQRDKVATPLLLTEQEFLRSLDAFPLEYAEIQRHYELVFGRDPFLGSTIELVDLRRACETQVKSHLLHLREGFVEAAGAPRAVADLVRAAAPAFGSLLRNISRLKGTITRDTAHAMLDGARYAQLPEAVVADILAIDQPAGIPAADAARLFPSYLAAVEQLARFVDTWRT